jgi:hypothetical protein
MDKKLQSDYLAYGFAAMNVAGGLGIAGDKQSRYDAFAKSLNSPVPIPGMAASAQILAERALAPPASAQNAAIARWSKSLTPTWGWPVAHSLPTFKPPGMPKSATSPVKATSIKSCPIKFMPRHH